MSLADERAALARMVRYCEDEANSLNLPFVAYCLSLATGALAEELDEKLIDWDSALRLRSRKREST